MKILITGGAGFLGINLVRFLREKNFSDILSYDLADFTYPEEAGIEVLKADIRDLDTLMSAMSEVTIVIHAAAALPLYSKKDIFSTDIEGTKNVMEAAHANQVERVIMISSTAVYGIPDHHPLKEEDEMIGVGDYGVAKIRAEELCQKYREKGMCISIIRPKSFIGPERLGVFALFFEWAKDGKNFPIIGKGTNRYQLLDVHDLCDAIYRCMTRQKELVNDTFNIGAKEFGTMKEDYQIVLDSAGFGKKAIGFPEWLIVLPLRILEFFKLSPIYKWIYETAGKDSFVSIEKAERILGYEPLYSNQEALLRNYSWYLKNYESFQHQQGVSHRVPWKQGILKVFKVFF